MSGAVVFDNVLISIFLYKLGFLVIGIMDVELSTFVGYTWQLHLGLLLESIMSEHLKENWHLIIFYARNLINHFLPFTLGFLWVLSVQILDVENPYLHRVGSWPCYQRTSLNFAVESSKLWSVDSTFQSYFRFILSVGHGVFLSQVKFFRSIWGFGILVPGSTGDGGGTVIPN